MSETDIVLLAPATWSVATSLPHYTARVLAKTNRVLIVEPLTAVSTLIREARWQKRDWTFKHGIRQLDRNLWLYTPPALGLPGHMRAKFVGNCNARIASVFINRVIRQLAFHNPLIWTFGYNTASLIRHLSGRLRIYDCGDNFEAFARNDRQRKLVRFYETETCKAADLVFACTEELAEARSAPDRATYAVPCAAELEFFGQAILDDTVVPADIAGFAKPVIGYVGGCDPLRLDLDLIRHVASTHPEWSLVFVGYIWFGFDKGKLADLPNVHFLGSKSYSNFPAYLKGMDVCIAPFHRNELTRYGDMLKIYEYLASGRPVVSTTNPAARRLEPTVRIADDPVDFVAAIEAELTAPESARDQRMLAVQPHNWDNRVKEKWRLMERFLKAAGSDHPGPG
ncbi:MAG: glycosyltransferase [Planctomycetaceae bacterium]|nr:glycosyltransferase [Planctomycetaceae bacterium]